MRAEEHQEPEPHGPEPVPHPPAHADPPAAAALLALQRSAGNAAVGRMLARKFYAESDGGKLVWHPEALDPALWDDTGKSTSWLLWNYPVYRPKPSAAEAEQQAAPARKKRPRRTKKKPAAVTEAATPELVEEEPEDVVEDESEAAGPEETPPAVVDDDGFVTVKSARAEKADRDQAADTAALAKQVDDHAGAPAAILETFNKLFNARVAQGLAVEGTIVESYTSSYDRKRAGYSIEVTIPSLANWVVHAHLESDGTVAPGENATHYKRLVDKHSLGVSIALLPKQLAALLPDEATRLAAKTTRRHASL